MDPKKYGKELKKILERGEKNVIFNLFFDGWNKENVREHFDCFESKVLKMNLYQVIRSNANLCF